MQPPLPSHLATCNLSQMSKGSEETDSHSGAESGFSPATSSSDQSDLLDSLSARKRRRTSPAAAPAAVKTRSAPRSEIDDDDDTHHQGGDDADDDDAGDGHIKGAATGNHPRPSLLSLMAAPSRVKRSVGASPGDPQSSVEPQSRIMVPTDPSTSFSALQVQPWLVQSLGSMAIKRPTRIQKACIPEILKGRDCIGGSRTGSGKTVAFAVPILQQWAQDPSAIFALILTPTRELALQIYEQFKALSSPQSLKALLVIGGSDMRAQAVALAQRPHVVIATPGRLADHIRTSGQDTICGLGRVRFVVLDEADRLLHAAGPGSMLPEVEECLEVLPPAANRQTLLFTATMTPEVAALKSMPPKAGKQPVFVCEVDTQMPAIPSSLAQAHVQIPVTHKEHYLHVFLLTEGNREKTTIIFCNRTRTAEYLHHLLRLLDHRVTSLHSKLPQKQRIDNLARFRASAARILVATDVAARGLDIPEVSLVINYDIPRNPDDYIHRVGRTARAGRKGEAVTFVGQRDVELVLAIEKRVGRQMMSWKEEGVNLETRVIRDVLKLVSEKKREALLEVEEGREVGGKRKRTKQSLRAE